MSALKSTELAGVIRQLPPLATTGCSVPLVALARATYLRQRVLAILWQQAPAGARARLLALVCAQNEARWWCRPTAEPLLLCLRRYLAASEGVGEMGRWRPG